MFVVCLVFPRASYSVMLFLDKDSNSNSVALQSLVKRHNQSNQSQIYIFTLSFMLYLKACSEANSWSTLSTCEGQKQTSNLIRRVFSVFKMAARRRPWQTAGHVSPKILEILIVSNGSGLYDWLIYGHVICCLPGFSLSRHFERREDPGDEVGKRGK